MPEQRYSIVDLKKYLSQPVLDYPVRSVSSSEFAEFWNALTDEEKLEFKSTPLD